MFDNKKLNLFFIGLLCILVASKARSISLSQIGDVRIEVSDDKWLCDKIECPADTSRCYVSKHKDSNDPTILVRTNICYSKDNRSLKESRTNEKIHRNSNINLTIHSLRNGITSSVDSYNAEDGDGENFDEEKFKEKFYSDLKKMQDNLDKQMAEFNTNLQEQMSNLHKNLENMNQNINRGIEQQMNDLNEQLSNMFN